MRLYPDQCVDLGNLLDLRGCLTLSQFSLSTPCPGLFSCWACAIMHAACPSSSSCITTTLGYFSLNKREPERMSVESYFSFFPHHGYQQTKPCAARIGVNHLQILAKLCATKTLTHNRATATWLSGIPDAAKLLSLWCTQSKQKRRWYLHNGQFLRRIKQPISRNGQSFVQHKSIANLETWMEFFARVSLDWVFFFNFTCRSIWDKTLRKNETIFLRQ